MISNTFFFFFFFDGAALNISKGSNGSLAALHSSTLHAHIHCMQLINPPLIISLSSMPAKHIQAVQAAKCTPINMHAYCFNAVSIKAHCTQSVPFIFRDGLVARTFSADCQDVKQCGAVHSQAALSAHLCLYTDTVHVIQQCPVPFLYFWLLHVGCKIKK